MWRGREGWERKGPTPKSKIIIRASGFDFNLTKYYKAVGADILLSKSGQPTVIISRNVNGWS